MNRNAMIVAGVCLLLAMWAVVSGPDPVAPDHSVPPGDHDTPNKAVHRNAAESAFVEGTLESLLLEGPQLHQSLRTRPMDDTVRHLPAGLKMPANPHLSTRPDILKAIAGAGSQGQLNADGVRAVLYALYVDKNELGFYGVETEHLSDADWRERQLRRIWARNIAAERVRIHRRGLVIVVIWTDGVTPECWESVNQKVSERLGFRAR